MKRATGLLIPVFLGACASAPPQPAARCFVEDEATALRIAAVVSGVSADDGSLQVEDRGDHWRVGRYAETWLGDDGMIMSRDAGFSFDIDKCTGAMTGYRAWP